MKLVLLTSDSLRHNYLAHSLGEDLQLVIIEQKSLNIQDTSAYSSEDAQFIRQHFKARFESEKKFFGSYEAFPKQAEVLKLPHGAINTFEAVKAVEKVAPDFLVLFGTSIIKEPLLKKFKGRIVNVHLGLSPYYRGSATNLYPYFYEEPECVGATIHLATREVDKGSILHQLRPEIKEEDSLHDIGNKTILKAGQILPLVLKKYNEGAIGPLPQKGSGRLTRNKDITPYVLKEIYRNFEEGMIQRYLYQKEKRDGRKPIVEQV